MKKGVELSMNFFVIIVLSIVILGFGLKMVYDLLSASSDAIESFGGCDDAYVERLLSDARVATCPANEKLARGHSAKLWIGYKNTDEGQPHYFQAKIVPSGAVDKNGDSLNVDLSRLKVAFISTAENLEPGTSKKQAVVVSADKSAEKATYVLDVIICDATGRTVGQTLVIDCAVENAFAVEKIYLNVI